MTEGLRLQLSRCDSYVCPTRVASASSISSSQSEIHCSSFACSCGVLSARVACSSRLACAPANNKAKPPVWPTSDPIDRVEPSLDTLVPTDPNMPYDMKELIVKVADEYSFFEIQPDYARNIIIGFIRMEGSTVGVVEESISKATPARRPYTSA